MTGPLPSAAAALEVVVSAWIGSPNVGDELVHAGLRRLLEARGVLTTAVSLDPTATVERYGGRATTRGRLVLELATGRRRAPLLLGGGGLLQDETSTVNVPYHLLPLAVARARGLPVAGIGLGAGPLRGPAARRLAARALRGIEVSARDEWSADEIASLGLPRPAVAADLALELPDPPAGPPTEVLAVALRPWDGRHRVPVGLRQRARPAPDPRQVARLAAAVDSAAGRLGVGVRFVAFGGEADEALHRAVAERVRADVTDMVVPDPHGAVAAIADSCAVLAMRYHAGIAALMARRPAVLLPYSPKVGALAADVGRGFVAITGSGPLSDAVGDAAARALREATDGVLDDAIDRLRRRGATNGAVIDQLLDPVRRDGGLS